MGTDYFEDIPTSGNAENELSYLSRTERSNLLSADKNERSSSDLLEDGIRGYVETRTRWRREKFRTSYAIIDWDMTYCFIRSTTAMECQTN